MKCKTCGKEHLADHMHFKTVSKLKDKGYPTKSSKYPSAHKKANKEEKKAFPKGFEKMKKVDANLAKDELAGKHTKSGKIEVSKKVPRALRKEVAYHEIIEHKKMSKK